MAGRLAGVRVAFLVATEGNGQVELTEPWREAQLQGSRVGAGRSAG